MCGIWVNQTFNYMPIKLIHIPKGTEYDFNWQKNDKLYFISMKHQLSLKRYVCGSGIPKIHSSQNK